MGPRMRTTWTACGIAPHGEADPGHGGDYSFYFGRKTYGDYDVGATAGRIVSQPIEVAGVDHARLFFHYLLETEATLQTVWRSKRT